MRSNRARTRGTRHADFIRSWSVLIICFWIHVLFSAPLRQLANRQISLANWRRDIFIDCIQRCTVHGHVRLHVPVDMRRYVLRWLGFFCIVDMYVVIIGVRNFVAAPTRDDVHCEFRVVRQRLIFGIRFGHWKILQLIVVLWFVDVVSGSFVGWFHVVVQNWFGIVLYVIAELVIGMTVMIWILKRIWSLTWTSQQFLKF